MLYYEEDFHYPLFLLIKYEISVVSYMIDGLLVHELLDHRLNDRIELGLDICVVEVLAHLILIS
jgi:hypothetical protein